MRVATWNVNGLRARMEFVVHWLNARAPDVVAFQELKLEEGHFPTMELGALGYASAFVAQKGWNGVAVLSRAPITLDAISLPGQDALGARFMVCTTGGLSIASVYVPNGKDVRHGDFVRKLEFLDALAVSLGAAGPGAPDIVGGDFNLCPGPLDTWSEGGFAGRIFHTDAERSRFAAVLAAGYHDLYREAEPDGHAFSWWDYRAGDFHQGRGLRIDFLLARDEVRRRMRSVTIDREYRKKKEGLTTSDHAPVYVDLD